jgi:DNA-binding beta-propeller fold protein YncE
VRIDPRRGTVIASIELGGTPARVAPAADGTIWVTDKERNRIVRIDQTANTVVDELAAGPGAYALARAARSVWVTSYAGDDVRRYVASR